MSRPTLLMPSIGARAGKIWGTTQPVFARNDIECHLIRFEKGGFCSCHSHQHKYNRFVGLSGRLIVRVFPDDSLMTGDADETRIGVGDIVDVEPGVLHEFEAVESGTALEIYWVTLDPDDIDRGGTCGGMKTDDS